MLEFMGLISCIVIVFSAIAGIVKLVFDIIDLKTNQERIDNRLDELWNRIFILDNRLDELRKHIFTLETKDAK